MNAEFTTPLAVAALVITGAPRVMVNTTVTLDEVPAVLLAVTTVLVVPGVVGVPDIIPVAASSVRPGGSGEAVKPVNGLLVAVIA